MTFVPNRFMSNDSQAQALLSPPWIRPHIPCNARNKRPAIPFCDHAHFNLHSGRRRLSCLAGGFDHRVARGPEKPRPLSCPPSAPALAPAAPHLFSAAPFRAPLLSRARRLEGAALAASCPLGHELCRLRNRAEPPLRRAYAIATLSDSKPSSRAQVSECKAFGRAAARGHAPSMAERPLVETAQGRPACPHRGTRLTSFESQPCWGHGGPEVGLP